MGENNDVNQSSSMLLDFVRDASNKLFEDKARECNLLRITPVLVKTYSTETKRANVAFLSSPNTPTSFTYANKTGHDLEIGQKIYLISLFGDYSQGWLDDNLPR